MPYDTVDAPPGTTATVQVGGRAVPSFDGTGMPTAEFGPRVAAFNAELGGLLGSAGYPATADPARVDKPMVALLLFALMFLATMVYGPMAALLVEMFPPQIRYSSVSTAYNVGNGWFGGFTSPIAFALIAASGDIFAGTWYCLGVIGLSLIVGGLFLRPAHLGGEPAVSPAPYRPAGGEQASGAV